MDEEAIVNELLRRLLADDDRGELKSPSHYQLLFPGHDDLVARECALFLEDHASSPQASARASNSLAGEERFGPYRLLGTLGQGGQGMVYLAEDTRLGRRVALKLLAKVAHLSDQAVERFRREALIASKLEDPGICDVFEAGTLDGTPFIAMRLVRGDTLATHIERARSSCGSSPGMIDPPSLTPGRASLENVLCLFESIARSLHKAHESGVVHRDIKPGNVMVMQSGQPVILDFGLARIQDDSFATLTTTGDLFGTPAYMSPEQVTAAPLDRRTDIYSLGVTLYECVTLRRPFESPTREELFRAIAVADPSDPRSLNPLLPKDLKVVLDVVLEKNVDRRYQTALDFAEDLRRLRTGEVILARPPSYGHQLRKVVLRHRAVVRTVAAVFLVLVAGLITTIWQARVAVAERDRARHEASIANAVNEFINADLLAASDPEHALGRKITVREVLDRAAAAIESRFASQPLVEAAIRLTIGNAYRNLGELGRAAVHLERGVELRRRELGEEDPATLAALSDLGWLFYNQGRLDDAERVYSAVLSARQRVLGPDHEHTLDSMTNLGMTYLAQQRLEDAERMLPRALEAARRTRSMRHRQTLQMLTGVAGLREYQQRFEEAGELYEEAMRGFEETLSRKHPATLSATGAFATFLKGQGRFREAETMFRDLVERQREVLGPGNLDTLLTLNNMAALANAMGHPDQAKQLCLQALEGLERLEVGREHQVTLSALFNLAIAHKKEGRFQEAEKLLIEVLEVQRRLPGGARTETLRTEDSLAGVYDAQGRLEEAEQLGQEVLKGMLALHGEEHEDTLFAMLSIARRRRQQGKNDEARALYDRVISGFRRVRGDDHPDTLSAMDSLGVLLLETRQQAAAKSVLVELAEKARDRLPDDHPQLPIYLAHLGQCYLAADEYAEAEPVLLEAYELLAVEGEAEAGPRAMAAQIARLYRAWGKPDLAEVWQARTR